MKNGLKGLLLVCVVGALPFSTFAQSERYSSSDPWRDGYDAGFRAGYEKAMSEGRMPPPIAVVPAPIAAPNGPIRIESALYGSFSRTCDATRFVGRKANGRRSFSMDITNEICGDPHHGERKSMNVTYYCGDFRKVASAGEHRTLTLSCAW